MDYKYIEQLLDRYWQCETTLQEEAILKAFFAQEVVPEHLKQYKNLFAGALDLSQAALSSDFEKKLMARIEAEQPIKAQRVTMVSRLMPLYKAVASIAIVLTLGNAAQTSFHHMSSQNDYNYDSYEESYSDPTMAYDQVSDALQMVSQGLNDAYTTDSLASDTNRGINQ